MIKIELFAVSPRGADHNRSGAYEADSSGKVDRLRAGPEAARHAVESEDRAAAMDRLILCKLLRCALPEQLGAMVLPITLNGAARRTGG